jgi:AcrR family transcriptional regulator
MSEPSPSNERILQVAIELWAQKGYEATSTREIVEAAGVTKPMLYYYFGNKEGLCRAAMRRCATEFYAVMYEMTSQHREPYDMLVEFVWTHFVFLKEHRNVMLFYMSLYFGPARRKFADEFNALICEARTYVDEFLGGILATGILRPDCRDEFATSLRGMIDAWDRSSVIEGVELTHDLAKRVVDNLLHGFAA